MQIIQENDKISKDYDNILKDKESLEKYYNDLLK